LKNRFLFVTILVVFMCTILAIPWSVWADAPLLRGAVDIIVILDTTGSMGDEINSVKNYTSYFAQQLQARGYDYRLGLIEYKDKGESGCPRWFGFTSSVTTFTSWVSGLYASGGGDWEESGIDAMMLAENVFISQGRVGAGKMIILVTDAPFHEPENGRYAQDEGRSLGSRNIVTNIIGYDANQANRLLAYTRGKFYYLSAGIKNAYDDILNQIGINHWPQINNVTYLPAVPFVNNSITLSASASDADGDPLVYTWTAKKPNGQQVQLGQGSTISFTPDMAGTWEVTVTVNDPYGALASASRTINVAAYELSASLEPNPVMRGQKVRVYAALTVPAPPSAAQYSGYRASPYDEVLEAEGGQVTRSGSYGYSPDGKVVWLVSGWLEARFSRPATAVYIQFNSSDYNDGYAKVYVDGTYYGSFQTQYKGHNYIRVGNLPATAHTVRVENSGGDLHVDFFGAAFEPAGGERSTADSIYVVLPNGQQVGMNWDSALQRYWCEFLVPDGGLPGTWPGNGTYTVKVRATKYGVTKEISLSLTVQGNIKEKMYIRTLEW